MAVLVEMSYKHVFDHLGFKYKHFHLKPAFLCFFAFVWGFFFQKNVTIIFRLYKKPHALYAKVYLHEKIYTKWNQICKFDDLTMAHGRMNYHTWITKDKMT